MNKTTPLPSIDSNQLYGQGDIFVLFGELFGRGYATGLVDAAKAAGMTIIGITVGRRDDDNRLRPLNDEEISQAETNLGGKIINLPLMAGFDLDAPAGGPTPTDLVNEMTVEGWQSHKLNLTYIDECKKIGTERFQSTLSQVMTHLDDMIPSGSNVFFAHTMAGGIPRAKVFMAVANRIYKGRGARYIPSQSLIDSDLGKLILENFDEVTANSFQYLIDASRHIRSRVEEGGNTVRYTAYGYHGTRILIGDEYHWQTYTSYTQGYAKMRLEEVARTAWNNGVKATVFNCPEIRTNSSDVFAGIELSLLPLLRALRREGDTPWVSELWAECQDLLKDGASLESVLHKVDDYLEDPAMKPFRNFEAWPMQNSPEQIDKTVSTSQNIVALHEDRKRLISDLLSQHVVDATGQLIFGAANQPAGPVLWLDHDVVARQLIYQNQG